MKVTVRLSATEIEALRILADHFKGKLINVELEDASIKHYFRYTVRFMQGVDKEFTLVTQKVTVNPDNKFVKVI